MNVRRAARSILAALCLLGAALAGGAWQGSSPLLDAAADKTPTAQAALGQSGKLLRPKAGLAVAQASREANAGGAGTNPHLAITPNAWLSHPGTAVGPIAFHISAAPAPAGLAIRAGYSRAPPILTGRSRTVA